MRRSQRKPRILVIKIRPGTAPDVQAAWENVALCLDLGGEPEIEDPKNSATSSIRLYPHTEDCKTVEDARTAMCKINDDDVYALHVTPGASRQQTYAFNVTQRLHLGSLDDVLTRHVNGEQTELAYMIRVLDRFSKDANRPEHEKRAVYSLVGDAHEKLWSHRVFSQMFRLAAEGLNVQNIPTPQGRDLVPEQFHAKLVL